MRFGNMVLAGFALTISVLAGACAPEGPSPAPSTAPVSTVSTVSPGPQSSPTATGTPSPADIEATLTRIAQFDQHLKQLSADNPSPNDLANSMQDMLTLMDYVTTYYPQMTAQQRTQALGVMTGILGDEVPVVNTQARVFRVTATAFAVAHPSATISTGTQTPLATSPQVTPAPTVQGPTATVVATGTPTALPTVAATQTPTSSGGQAPSPVATSTMSQITDDLHAISTETANLVSGQPTDQDILSYLGRLQTDLGKLSQLSSSMSASDMVSALKDMDRAVANLAAVVQALTNQESSAIATPVPPATPTSPSTPTPAAPTSLPAPPPTSTPAP